MRNPLRNAFLWIVLLAASVATVWFVSTHYAQVGKIAGGILGVAGLTTAAIAVFMVAWSLLAAFGRARLLSGRTAIARWHVSAAEWERFCAFDAIRAESGPSLRNELKIGAPTVRDGVDVIVGSRQIAVDGAYHALLGIPILRDVYWLPAPADPECLEFAVSYPRGRTGGTVDLSLRVPVPDSARVEGMRVFEHYKARAVNKPKA